MTSGECIRRLGYLKRVFENSREYRRTNKNYGYLSVLTDFEMRLCTNALRAWRKQCFIDCRQAFDSSLWKWSSRYGLAWIIYGLCLLPFFVLVSIPAVMFVLAHNIGSLANDDGGFFVNIFGHPAVTAGMTYFLRLWVAPKIALLMGRVRHVRFDRPDGLAPEMVITLNTQKLATLFYLEIVAVISAPLFAVLILE